MPPRRSIFSWDKSDEALLPRSDSLPQSRLCRMASHMPRFPFSWSSSVTVIWEYAGSSNSLLTRAAVHAVYLYSSAAVTAYQRTSKTISSGSTRLCETRFQSWVSKPARTITSSTEINRRSKIKSGRPEFILVSPRYQCSRGLFSPQTKLPPDLFITGERERQLDVHLKYLLSSAPRCATAKREDGNLNLLQVPLTQSIIQGKFRFAVISSLGLSPSQYRQLWRALLTRGGYQLRHWVPWYRVLQASIRYWIYANNIISTSLLKRKTYVSQIELRTRHNLSSRCPV